MMEIKIKDGMADVYTPYNPYFVRKIKGIGGTKWVSSEKCWRVPEAAIEAVREMMKDVYGYSDVMQNETVTLKVTFNEEVRECQDDIVLFGKVLARVYGRDSGAKIGEDVAFIKGGAGSGGSVKNWESYIREGSVVILSNVNKSLYERRMKSLPSEIEVEVLNKIDKKQLSEEKERLLNRIAEIDRILAEEGQ